MQSEVIPVIVGVVAMFAAFIGVLGAVSVWLNMSDRNPRT